MSMSTYVCGFKPPDKKWKEMKAIYDSCEKAGIDVPDEVDEFFEGEIPDNTGVKVWLSETSDCCTEYVSYAESGYEIDLNQLPKDIKIIRFVNSY